MTESQAEQVVADLNQNYQQTAQQLAVVEAEQHKAAELLQQTNQQLATLRAKEEQQAKLTNELLILKGELKTQNLLLNQLAADKQMLVQELQLLPVVDELAAATAKNQLQQLDQQIAAAESQLLLANEQAAEAKRLQRLQQDLAINNAEIAGVEVLVKALGPNGLKKDLLESILAGFLERANNRLSRLTAGSYYLTLAEDMELMCRANGGPILPLKLLSKSEQLRVGIAIQECLSAAAGLRFLAIDETDILDQENRDLLTTTLLQIAEDYDQVLVFTTVGEVKPQNPGVAGVKMFWLEEGTVREM